MSLFSPTRSWEANHIKRTFLNDSGWTIFIRHWMVGKCLHINNIMFYGTIVWANAAGITDSSSWYQLWSVQSYRFYPYWTILSQKKCNRERSIISTNNNVMIYFSTRKYLRTSFQRYHQQISVCFFCVVL